VTSSARVTPPSRIAETTHYLTTGKRIQGGRPKGDMSSYQVLNPEDGNDGGAGKPKEGV
jgi:hypothetical protein